MPPNASRSPLLTLLCKGQLFSEISAIRPSRLSRSAASSFISIIKNIGWGQFITGEIKSQTKVYSKERISFEMQYHNWLILRKYYL